MHFRTCSKWIIKCQYFNILWNVPKKTATKINITDSPCISYHIYFIMDINIRNENMLSATVSVHQGLTHHINMVTFCSDYKSHGVHSVHLIQEAIETRASIFGPCTLTNAGLRVQLRRASVQKVQTKLLRALNERR